MPWVLLLPLLLLLSLLPLLPLAGSSRLRNVRSTVPVLCDPARTLKKIGTAHTTRRLHPQYRLSRASTGAPLADFFTMVDAAAAVGCSRARLCVYLNRDKGSNTPRRRSTARQVGAQLERMDLQLERIPRAQWEEIMLRVEA